MNLLVTALRVAGAIQVLDIPANLAFRRQIHRRENLVRLSPLLAAALFLAAGQFGLGASIGLASYGVSSRPARVLLRLSSLSLALGMCMAFLWAWGEYAGRPLLNLPQMARWHGVPNAFGFTLSGLLGWSISAFPSHARGQP